MTKKDKKINTLKNKKKKKKNYAIAEIRTRGTWVQNPRTHPLRHGGLCEIQFKIINIYA